MPLPDNGQISMNQIRVELGISGQTSFSLHTAVTGGYVTVNNCSSPRPSPAEPSNIAEWYGYNHTAPCGTLYCLGYSTSNCNTACDNI